MTHEVFDFDSEINRLIGAEPVASDPISKPSRHDNLITDLGQLPKGERGFLGVHLVQGEDGHIMNDTEDKPMRIVDLPHSVGRTPNRIDNPFVE